MNTHDRSVKKTAYPRSKPESQAESMQVEVSESENFDAVQYTLQKTHKETLSPHTVLQLQRVIGNQATQQLLQHKDENPEATRQVSVKNKDAQEIQRLILHIGTPSKDASRDFPTLAARLLSEKIGETFHAFNMYQVPQPNLISSFLNLFTSPSKETLYIVAHGNPTSIVGYNDANALHQALVNKGFSENNLSKIVLVACSTGGRNDNSDTTNFARDLAGLMNVTVYGANQPLDIHFETPIYGAKVSNPTHFTLNDREVDVVEGEGLTAFSPSGGGYVPPVL